MGTTDNKIRVGFTGASGTGKTTLAKAIAECFGVPLNPVGSRSVAKSMGFDNPYDVDKANLDMYNSMLMESHSEADAAQAAMEDFSKYGAKRTVRALFQKRLQIEKINWEMENESFVSDRTTVDDFCYACMHCEAGVIDKDFMRRAAHHMSRYDIVFHTPMAAFIHVDSDPARVNDIPYHYAFESMARSVLEDWCSFDIGKPTVRKVRQSKHNDRRKFVLVSVNGLLAS